MKTILELLIIPGLNSKDRLEQLRLESKQRMDKTYERIRKTNQQSWVDYCKKKGK